MIPPKSVVLTGNFSPRLSPKLRTQPLYLKLSVYTIRANMQLNTHNL